MLSYSMEDPVLKSFNVSEFKRKFFFGTPTLIIEPFYAKGAGIILCKNIYGGILLKKKGLYSKLLVSHIFLNRG